MVAGDHNNVISKWLAKISTNETFKSHVYDRKRVAAKAIEYKFLTDGIC